MMYWKTLLALASAAAVLAAPTPAPSDTMILQVALSLEHLESNFYTSALQHFDAQAFADAGYPPWVRGRFEQIAMHEATHVKFLQDALGPNAPQPCSYSFPYTDVNSFVSFAMSLEGVGAAATLGVVKIISDEDIRGAAASIMAVEQRHEGWISSAARKLQPWDGPFATPLGLSGGYSLAKPFITSCPTSNPPLPVKILPALSVSSTSPQPGSTISLTYSNPSNASPVFLVWFSGLEAVFASIDANNNTVVPHGLHGTVYVGVMSSDQMPMSDDAMVTDLAIMYFPFDSMALELDNE